MLMQTWLYVLSMFTDIGLLLAQLYFIIMYSDLEADYINPMELCETMDWALPIEAVVQAVITAAFLFTGEWLSLFFTAPVTIYNAYRYSQTKLKFDATTIFKTVRNYRIESIIKLIWYFVLFCYFLYSMIWALVQWTDSTY